MNKYGFIEPTIAPDEWVLSGEWEIINPTGQYDQFLPLVEYQRKNGVETMSCVIFTILNVIETITKVKYDVEPNYSERWTAIHAGTTSGGTDIQTACDAVRKKGCIPEYMLPFAGTVHTIEDFLDKSLITQNMIDFSEEWLDTWDVMHDWVVLPTMNLSPEQKQSVLMEKLETSPLAVSVDAWRKDGKYYTKVKGARDNHMTLLYGYVENKFWKIYDTYDNTYKELAWDYDFNYVKRFSISKKDEKKIPEKNENQQLISDMFDMVIKLIQKIRSMLGF